MNRRRRLPYKRRRTRNMQDHAMTAATQTTVPNHPPVKFGKVGVLLVNLGTPDGTDYSVDAPISQGIPDRPAGDRMVAVLLVSDPVRHRAQHAARRRSARPMRRSGTRISNESYLRTYTRNQAEKMAERLCRPARMSASIGPCATASRRSARRWTNCRRTAARGSCVFPLYPQYAAATTATVNDKAFKALLKMRWQPALRTVAALS